MIVSAKAVPTFKEMQCHSLSAPCGVTRNIIGEQQNKRLSKTLQKDLSCLKIGLRGNTMKRFAKGCLYLLFLTVFAVTSTKADEYRQKLNKKDKDDKKVDK